METKISTCRFRVMFKNHKRKAKYRGVAHTLSLEEYISLKTSKVCFYTGLSLDIDTKHRYHALSHTLERIDPNKGYSLENTKPCSYLMNSWCNLKYNPPKDKNRKIEKPRIRCKVLSNNVTLKQLKSTAGLNLHLK